MNEHEAERIAAAIHHLRPDWPVRSLLTLIARPELVHKPRRDVAVALAWIACETNTATPARVIENGPWWKAAAVEEPHTTGRRRSPHRSEECRRHPGEWPPPNCRPCATEGREVEYEGARDEDPELSHVITEPQLSRDEAIAACRLAVQHPATTSPLPTDEPAVAPEEASA